MDMTWTTHQHVTHQSRLKIPAWLRHLCVADAPLVSDLIGWGFMLHCDSITVSWIVPTNDNPHVRQFRRACELSKACACRLRWLPKTGLGF